MNKYHMFYMDYITGQESPTDKPIEATLDVIIRKMEAILRHPENFIGIIDKDENTLQFMAESNGKICIDLPIEKLKGSYSKYDSLQACLAMVEKLDGIINIDDISDLEFNYW